MLSIALLGTAGIAVWAGRFDPGLRQLAAVLAVFVAACAAGLFWADRLLRSAIPDAAAPPDRAAPGDDGSTARGSG